MPSFQTSRRVLHSAGNMFDLVADVEKYPQFVPLCQSIRVRGRRELEDGRVVLISDMTVAYKVFSEIFATRVMLDKAEHRITVEYLEGPFRHLENKWNFKPLGENSCEVGFYITYEFCSRALGSLMGTMFDKAFRKFATAFEARADEMYGAA
ncbi:type II toxin-antitoxin system RatA family toxin [Breoghania sp.]|uniref:type II toxin-antitoxin system RatA family toxin n=1 Tax=Breoghania sp. TaxID=2065378 RepID=UPI00262E675F|nr:type II toxin-antitoxin system RatA family toxin [Breoghania sp.]MDJ0930757.1 type II toxin-antitoxin system RatA family toxin [Breoghania sp.]